MIKKFTHAIPLIIMVILIIFIGWFLIESFDGGRGNDKGWIAGDGSVKKEKTASFAVPDLYDAAKILSFNNKSDDSRRSYILNIFASWCSTCHIEHEMLLNLARRGDIEIYGIAWNDTPDDVMEYLEENGNPYSAVGLDNQNIVKKALGVDGVPETFVIDKDGYIFFKEEGNLQPYIFEVIESLKLESQRK